MDWGETGTLRHSALAGCNGDTAPFPGEPLAYPPVTDPSHAERSPEPEAKHSAVAH